MQKFYAHTKKNPDGSVFDPEEWEPLFSTDCKTLKGEECKACKNLDSHHGHLNKVAYLCSKFAAEMFPEGSEDSKLAAEWGRLAGLWHNLGKFSSKFQSKLYGENISVEHSGAGAAFAKMVF